MRVSKLVKLYRWVYWRSWAEILNYILHVQLYLNGVTRGKGVRTMNSLPKVFKDDESSIYIGYHVIFNNYTNTSWFCRCSLISRNGGKLIIGDNTGLNGCEIVCEKSVNIGCHVMIGGGSKIFDTDFHPIDWRMRRDPVQCSNGNTADVVIEDDVFIGTNCIIEKGVTIGKRSIIAAGSVVTHSIPPDVIAGGVPCKVIRHINNEQS